VGRVHLGQSKSFGSKDIIRFKDWTKKEGSYLIIAIFSPNKYPSGAITFDEGNYLVRKTLDGGVAKELVKRYMGFKGDLMFTLEFDKENNVWNFYLDEVPLENGFIYNREGKNLIRRKEDLEL